MQETDEGCVSDRGQAVLCFAAIASVGDFILWIEKAAEGIGTGKQRDSTYIL